MKAPAYSQSFKLDARLGEASPVSDRLPWSSMVSAAQVRSVPELLGDRYTDDYKLAFPDVTPPYYPTGFLALVQLRTPMRKTKGGIILADETKDEALWRTQAALVRLLGPSCFRDRQTGEEWVEGPWFGVGDFVRIPLHGGDRFDVEFTYPDGQRGEVRFCFVREADVAGLVIGDPLNIKNS